MSHQTTGNMSMLASNTTFNPLGASPDLAIEQTTVQALGVDSSKEGSSSLHETDEIIFNAVDETGGMHHQQQQLQKGDIDGLGKANSLKEPLNSSSKDRDITYVRICAAIAALNSCNLGYDMGVNAGVAESLQRDEGSGIRLNDVQLEMFMGMLSFTALLGAVGMSYISDTYGRRATFMLSSAVFITGLTLIIISTDYGFMMFGRAILGFGIGLGLAIDPMYISEIAPADLRGFFVSCSEIAINSGIVLGYIASYALRNVPGNNQWRLMIALGLPMPVLLLILVLTVLPESPRWLIQHERIEEAGEVLGRLAHDDGHRVAREIKAEMDREHEESQGVTWHDLLLGNKVMQRKLIAGVGTAIAQQITAEEAILYYMISIFDDAGITSVSQQFGALVAVGIAKVAAIMVAGYLFDYTGRKPLLMMSNIGLAFALFLLAGVADHAPPAAFAALVLYVVAFSCGMGPGAWLIPSEVFSNDIRAKGMSLCTVSNRAAALAITSTFLSMRDGMGNLGTFSFFGVIALCNVVFFRYNLPETKGRSLEDIHVLFEEGSVLANGG